MKTLTILGFPFGGRDHTHGDAPIMVKIGECGYWQGREDLVARLIKEQGEEVTLAAECGSMFGWTCKAAAAAVGYATERSTVTVHRPDARCANCSREWDLPQLRVVMDLFERVEPGDEMPAGECPECGCLCFLTGDKEGST